MKFWAVRIASVVIAIVACLLLDRMALGLSDFYQRLILLAGLYVTLSVSLNLINGITGQFSIGHAAFYQVGAYTTGFLASRYFESAHLPPVMWLICMMVAGAITASIAGLIVGLPSLRLKGDYLAIVTLGFGEIIRIISQNQPALGGSYGMEVKPRFQYIWLVWLLAIFCIAVCRNMLKSAHGLPFLAVREDEVASSAMGVNVTRVKVTAFLLGSAFAGAAGALLAHNEGFVSPTMFAMDVSFVIVTMVVLGGTGSITGSAIAAVLLFYLPEKMRDYKDINLGVIVATFLAIALCTAAARKVIYDYHGSKLNKVGLYIGIAIIGLMLADIGGRLLSHIPALSQSVAGDKLRLVVFAVTLIMLMLLRPQGIFGHHEFSWSWVRRMFGKDGPRREVAA